MINESEWNRMISGELYSPWKVGGDSWSKVHVAQKAFNESEFWHDRTALNSLRECLEVPLMSVSIRQVIR